MMHLGITGGIGSGKSTVCKIFECLGIPIYYADDRAKHLMQHDAVLKAELLHAFGADLYNAEGELQRQYLAAQVFGKPERLAVLNALVHPAVGRDAETWQRTQSEKPIPYTLKEAALLYESGSWKQLSHIIVVHAPDELRIQRVMQRDQSPREAVLLRMASQWPQEKKMELADFLIDNSGQESILVQVLLLHHRLLRMAKASPESERE